MVGRGREEPLPIEKLIDLIVLYWQATDYGISSSAGLTADFVARAGRRVAELLLRAEQQFPRSPQVAFWKKYIAWTDTGGNLDTEECRELLRKYPDYKEPAMYVFSTSRGRECLAEALELHERVRDTDTFRARYVTSVIEAVLPTTLGA